MLFNLKKAKRNKVSTSDQVLQNYELNLYDK